MVQPWQVPVQALPQHTLSTQNPLAHSSVAVHEVPGVALGTHLPVAVWQ